MLNSVPTIIDTRTLLLVLSVSLVSSSITLVGALDGKSRLFFKDILENFDECRGVGWENDMLTRFTGIFFANFYTDGSHASSQIYCECQSHKMHSVQVRYDVFFATSEKDIGIFDFALVKDLLQSSSQDFANHPVTSILGTDGTITELRDNELVLYEIFTFHTCSTASCSADRDTEFDPNAIFFNIGSWNGIQGTELNPKKTYVFNIPIANGGTFALTSNNPKLLILSTTYIPLITTEPTCQMVRLPFFVIALVSTAGFLWLLEHTLSMAQQEALLVILWVRLDYTWENPSASVDIHDYISAGGYCDQYLGCIPNHATTIPPPIVPPTTETSETKTRTRIWPFTRLPFFRPKNYNQSTTTEATIITTRKPITTILDTTIAIVTSVPVIVTSDLKIITTYSETIETITDPTSTFETLTTLTSETTEVVTTTKTDTLEIFSDTSCLDNNTQIVTVDSTETETIV
ncbi:hypothetical protein PS15p_208476 [Mucor circinelloides]